MIGEVSSTGAERLGLDFKGGFRHQVRSSRTRDQMVCEAQAGEILRQKRRPVEISKRSRERRLKQNHKTSKAQIEYRTLPRLGQSKKALVRPLGTKCSGRGKEFPAPHLDALANHKCQIHCDNASLVSSNSNHSRSSLAMASTSVLQYSTILAPLKNVVDLN